MALLNLSISFFISRRRSRFRSSGERGLVWSLLFRLSPSSFRLPLDWISSCCCRNFISLFYLVSSSTMAASAWICYAKAAESWLNSIKVISKYLVESRCHSPQTAPNWWSVSSSVEWWRLRGIWPLILVPVCSMKPLQVLMITGVVPATTPSKPKSERDYGVSMK